MAKRIRFLLIAIITSGISALPAVSEMVSVEQDWTVFVETSPLACWATTAPLANRTSNTRGGKAVSVDRGDGTFLTVGIIPDNNIFGQISFTGGSYAFDLTAPASIEIDGVSFQLILENVAGSGDKKVRGWAWPSEADDAAVVAAMMKGSEAIVSTTSARGTLSKDTFSLLGVTAAVKAAQERCEQ